MEGLGDGPFDFGTKLVWDSRLVEKEKALENESTGAEVEEELDFDFSDLLAELRSELQNCKEEERRMTGEIRRELKQLEESHGSGDQFAQSFDQAVARLNNQLEPLGREVGKLANSLSAVHHIAENVASRVSALDTAKGRVIECLQLVSDLRDLKVCAEGVELAMKQEEFDEAAHHVHRFLTLDNAVFKIGDQIDVKDPGQTMRKSYETLRLATTELKEIIERKFDEAQRGSDVASMERFFKLFPLINEHTSGLQRLGKYLSGKIEKLGDDNIKIMQAGGTDDKRKNVLYADTLTMLLEGIARIIELHQPLVDNFYGPDKLLGLIEILQSDCDKQAIRVVNAFVSNRKFDQKARWVEECLNSMDMVDDIGAAEKMSALDLDPLLVEVTVMNNRAELFFRFLKRRLGEAPVRPHSESAEQPRHISRSASIHKGSTEEPTVADEIDEIIDETYETREQRKEVLERQKRQREERQQKLDKLLHRSALSMKMQEILGKYVLMEQYCMSESVKRAIDMDSVEEGALTSSILDDVFFIVRKSIHRTIGSSSVDCVCAIVNNTVTLLDSEFIKHIGAPIRLGYPGVGLAAEITQTAQTAINAWTETEGGPERQKAAFIVALNNLQSSISCIAELKAWLSDDFRKQFSQLTPLERGKFEHSISQLDDSLCKKLEHYINLSLSKLIDAAFKPKLRSSAEAYLDISHMLTGEELAEYEESNPFVENYIASVDKQLSQFESLLTPENHQALVRNVCAEAINQFERAFFKCTFNRLGALQLDKDLRQLVAYLSSIASWVVREKAARTSQIVNLLNSESIEEAIMSAQQSSYENPVVLLSNSDLRKVLLLRSDFPKDKVKAAKLG